MAAADSRENPPQARARPALALAAVAVAPLVFRAAVLADLGGASPGDLRGLLSDAGVSLLVAALLLSVARISRGVAWGLALLWVLLHYANLETVTALDAMASLHDLEYVGSRTFFFGSALAVSRPLLLAAVLAATGILGWVGLRGASLASAGRCGVAGLAVVLVHAAWPASETLPRWRQNDFVWHNARQLARGTEGAAVANGFPDAASAMRDLVPSLAGDLTGAPRIALPGSAANVLLVVLESVSGAYLPSLAADHGREAVIAMPRLDAVARANLSWSTFVSHQRKTNRGLFALLCGELPNLAPGTPKMTAYPAEGARACLPRVLRDAGYRTAFLQAAPLAFMLKDQFMPRAGFERVHGHEWFDEGYARNVWGVDDRAFFEQALPLVEELAAGDAPWFATLLNVGTHHPFVFPEEFRPELRTRPERALAHLDLAVDAFLRRLEASGILDDTLVLVTSDESLGVPGRRKLSMDATTQTLFQSWGFLVARLPAPRSERAAEPFAQMDLPLSVLDYLGLAQRDPGFFGRSVFRRYERPRSVFFANTNLGTRGAFDPAGRLLLCLDGARGCRAWTPAGGRVFHPQREPSTWDPARDDVVTALALRSVHPGRAAAAARRDLALVREPRFEVTRREPQVIHGGQYVDLAAGEWLEIELEVEARGAGGAVAFDHLLKNETPRALHVRRASLVDGQTLRTRYTFAPEGPVEAIQCHSLARLEEPPNTAPAVELRFHRARMTVHRSGARPDPGLQVHEFEITGAR